MGLLLDLPLVLDSSATVEYPNPAGNGRRGRRRGRARPALGELDGEARRV
jgi:hypothetical protein